MFFVYVVISDLSVFQVIVLLNPWFIISRNLILLFIDNETIGTSSFALVIWNVAPIMLLWCSDNTQSFVHDKTSSIWPFISRKSKNLQKLLRYLNGIVNSTFKAGTAGYGGRSGRGGWDPYGFSGGCDGRGGLSLAFPTIFVL